MSNWNDIDARRKARDEREQNAVQSLFTAIALQPTPEQEQRALSWLHHFAYETRSADHQEQDVDLREKLARMGVEVSIAHYTGDSSYPTEYTLTQSGVSAIGTTLDLTLMEFVEKLLAEKKRREGPALPPQEPQEPRH